MTKPNLVNNLHRQERRQLTVVFCDLVDSSSIAFTTDPEDFAAILQEYQSIVVDIVESYQGHIARYVGDGVLIYFGYPVADETDALRATLCSLDLLKNIRAIQVPNFEELTLEARIGIATGIVVIGEKDESFSSAASLAIGRTPYIAARLQEASSANAVYLTLETYRIVQNDIQCERIRPLKFKGSPSKTSVFHAIERKAVNTGKLGDPLLSLYAGRSREIAQVVACLESTHKAINTVVIVGEPGIGKTATAIHALRESGQAIDSVIDLHCSKIYTHNAYYPFAQYLAREIQKSMGELSTKSIILFLDDLGISESRYNDAVIRLLIQSESVPLNGAKDPFTASRELGQALVNVFIALLLDTKQTLFIDDLQWIDPSSLFVIEAIVDSNRVSGISILATQRAGEKLPFLARYQFNTVPLTRLGFDVIREIIASIDKNDLLDKATYRKIYTRSDGNPLFAEELTKSVLESCVSNKNSGKPDTDLDLETPSTIQDSITSRLDRLGEAKYLAQIAALIDRTISFKILIDIYNTVSPEELPVSTIEQQLNKLVFQNILIILNSQKKLYKFKHIILQESAANSMLHAERKRVHIVIATYFMQSKSNQNIYLSFHHYKKAEAHDKALQVLLTLIDSMITAGSFREARSLIAEGVELLDISDKQAQQLRNRLDLKLRLGYACMALYGYGSPKCEAVFRQSLELSETLNCKEGVFRSNWGLARYHTMNGRLKTGKEYARKLLNLSEQTGNSHHLLEANLIEGVANLWLGEFSQSLENYRLALSSVSSENDLNNMFLLYGEDPEVLCRSRMSFPIWVMGKTNTALESCERAVSRARDIDHVMSLIRAYTFKAWVHQFRGEASAVLALADKVIQLSKKNNHAFWQTCGELLQAWAIAHTDSLTKGTALFEKALQKSTSTGTLGKTYQNAQLAELYLLSNNFSKASEALGNAEYRASLSGDGFWKSELLRIKGVILAHDGASKAEGLHLMAESIKRASSKKALSLELRSHLSFLKFKDDGVTMPRATDRLQQIVQSIEISAGKLELEGMPFTID